MFSRKFTVEAVRLVTDRGVAVAQAARAGPVGYLIATTVLAYDDNRDLRRDGHGNPLTVTRAPRPEVLRGDPST